MKRLGIILLVLGLMLSLGGCSDTKYGAVEIKKTYYDMMPEEFTKLFNKNVKNSTYQIKEYTKETLEGVNNFISYEYSFNDDMSVQLTCNESNYIKEIKIISNKNNVEAVEELSDTALHIFDSSLSYQDIVAKMEKSEYDDTVSFYGLEQGDAKLNFVLYGYNAQYQLTGFVWGLEDEEAYERQEKADEQERKKTLSEADYKKILEENYSVLAEGGIYIADHLYTDASEDDIKKI